MLIVSSRPLKSSICPCGSSLLHTNRCRLFFFLFFYQGDIAIESFTCLLVFKNMFSFAMSWYAYDWLGKAGAKKLFIALGSVQVGIFLLSIPMCKFAREASSSCIIFWGFLDRPLLTVTLMQTSSVNET